MISFIIPLANRFESFRRCLMSLSRERTGYEIIVVDHDSQDGDVELAVRGTEVRAKIIQLPRPFVRSVALNAGAAVAEGNILFFLDADMEVPDGFVQMVAEKVKPRRAWFPRCIVQTQDGLVTPNHPLSVHGHGNCGIERSDFAVAGRWDEKYREWGKEDEAFHKAVLRTGIQVEREVLPGLLHRYHVPVKELNQQTPRQVQVFDPAQSGVTAVMKTIGPFVPPPPPPPDGVTAPVTEIGPNAHIGDSKQKDVLLATYTPTHALHLAKLRPWFESQGFKVYEKTGPWDYSWLPREQATIIVAWNCALERQKAFVEYARQECCRQFLVAEVGWFPGISKELGSARTLYLDRKGINAHSEIVDFHMPKCSVEMEEQLSEWLKAHRKLAPGRKATVLVPLQLENDTNIVNNSPHFKKMQDLIDFIEDKIDAQILFRQHPRDEKGKYHVSNPKSKITSTGDLYEQIAKAKFVIGINSTVLLEAMMFGKKVAAFGHGVFTGQKVVLDCSEDPELIYKIVKKTRQDRTFVDRRNAFLYEMIFRRQIEFADVPGSMARNRVMQEVLVQCE